MAKCNEMVLLGCQEPGDEGVIRVANARALGNTPMLPKLNLRMCDAEHKNEGG